MTVLVALLAAAAAILSYRRLESWTGRTWLPATGRAVAWASLALLLANATYSSRLESGRPLVLLDGSLSMTAAGGRWKEADSVAHVLGEVRLVGPGAGDTTPSAGYSRLAPAVRAAEASGRPVLVVTDGEVEDAGEIALASQGTGVRVLARRDVPDAAIVRVEAPERLTLADTVVVRAEVQVIGKSSSKNLEITLATAAKTYSHKVIYADANVIHQVELSVPAARFGAGQHVLRVALTNAGDAEPRDDVRLVAVTIAPTPGVVLLSAAPNWESRFLLATLGDVAALPVRGYFEAERGRWRRSGDLHPVSAMEVTDAARRADLLITMGGTGRYGAGSRARGRWDWLASSRTAGAAGDWYLQAQPASPVTSALAGLAVDSFPPGTGIAELTPSPRDWVGFTAQAGRRGAPRPVLIGRDSGRVRVITTGVEGLWRWAFGGGSAEQGYRSVVASAVSWLLGGADSAAGKARLHRAVVQRGRPAVFVANGADPGRVPIELSAAGTARHDTLAFDGAGRAEILLAPGVWEYRLGGGGQGTIAVEEYSDEWLPAPRTLESREGGAEVLATRRPLRARLWLFGLAVLAFAGEWLARRRLGMR